MIDPPPAIPAATLILMRDRPGSAPALLMVERSRALVFAGGALVFPGGRVDPGDLALAETLGSEIDDSVARLAAVRETLEEVGIAIGIDVGPAAAGRLRQSLHAGMPLGPALDTIGARVDLAVLTPFARWCPAGPISRRFDTRFYLAAAPANATGSVDQTENVRLTWASADAILAAADRAEVELIFPTRRVLERLATFSSLADAIADAALRPMRTVTPWEELRGGVSYLCIPGDLGYPVTAVPVARTRRS